MSSTYEPQRAAWESIQNRLGITATPGIATETVTIIVIPAHDATVARANLGGVTAAGSAKLEPGDQRNDSIGTDLAIARALALLSRKLERRARGKVRHAEAIKAARIARRARASEEILAELGRGGGGAGGGEYAGGYRGASIHGSSDGPVLAPGVRHEHQSKHDPFTLRVPGCPLCASWEHPAAAKARTAGKRQS